MKIFKLGFQFALTLGIPLLYLANILIAAEPVSNLNITPQLKILGILVAAFGLVFWILSYINLGKSFGVLPQKQKRLNSGLYKYFNHPMYIGISAVMIGFSIANSSFYGLAFYCVAILPILIIRARFEEKSLS